MNKIIFTSLLVGLGIATSQVQAWTHSIKNMTKDTIVLDLSYVGCQHKNAIYLAPGEEQPLDAKLCTLDGIKGKTVKGNGASFIENIRPYDEWHTGAGHWIVNDIGNRSDSKNGNTAKYKYFIHNSQALQ